MATQRAVAMEGVELVKGIHNSVRGGFIITIKRPDGLREDVHWRDDAVATPVLVEAMIQDMININDPEEIPEIREVRDALKEYCLDWLKQDKENLENPEIDGQTVGELSTMAIAFMDGYEAALKRKS